jgi:hypothetical protein
MLSCATLVSAQQKKQQDRKAIKDMCGCYEVTFAFAETFSPDANYKFHENYISTGLEWVELVEDKTDKIVLQHLLIVEDSVGRKDVVKHWRQDWLYENTTFYMFDRDNTWKFVELPKEKVKGQWTQKVFQVDDSPRYEGSATWIHADGRHFWENTTDSPLPRREFTKRSDYNVMRRRNRHEITNYGWVHEQDNDKILKSGAESKTIAQEKGWNTYKRTDDTKCQLAQEYWKEKKEFWATVRQEWNEIFAQNKDLKLEKIIDNKPLFMHLSTLSVSQTSQIKPIIKQFVKN